MQAAAQPQLELSTSGLDSVAVVTGFPQAVWGCPAGREQLRLLSFQLHLGLRPDFQMIIWGTYFHVASSTTARLPQRKGRKGEWEGGLVKSTKNVFIWYDSREGHGVWIQTWIQILLLRSPAVRPWMALSELVSLSKWD